MRFYSSYLMLLFFLLAGCQQHTYQPIPNQQSFVATLNIQEKSITFVDENGEKMTTWDLGKLYTGGWIQADDQTLVLYGPEHHTVDFYSLAKGELEKSWKLGNGITNGMYIEEISRFVFTDKDENAIRFIDQEGKETDSIEVGKYPMTMATAGENLYVSTYQDTKLYIIDFTRFQIEGVIDIPSDSTGLLVRSEDHEIWVGGHGKGTKPRKNVAIYSLSDYTLKEKLSAPLMPINFLENELGIYVLSHGTNKLYHFNDQKEHIQSKDIGANPFALDFFAGKIVVAGFDSNHLYLVNPHNLTIEKQIKVGKGPFTILKRE